MTTRTLLWPAIGLAALIAGCAAPAAAPLAPTDSLFADALFAAPSERVSTDAVFAVSEPMRRYLAHDIGEALRSKGAQSGLVDALHTRSYLKLEYDAAITRNAAEAFDARAGNCLSLIIMTAAFARELGLPVRFQSAYLDEAWSRAGSLLFASGHVNVTLGWRASDARAGRDASLLTIDFLPPEDIKGLRSREIGEETVLAMYANNRAAEALARDRLADAYAWAAEALRRDPTFSAAFNTLGVVYLRRGALPEAARVFEHVLAREPNHTRALANLSQAYDRQGRSGESRAMALRLAALEAQAPFHFFQLGLDAAQRNDWRTAREHFAREVERDDRNHEFQYWLGVADWQLGDVSGARKRLKAAMASSVTRGQHDLYAAKLSWLERPPPRR